MGENPEALVGQVLPGLGSYATKDDRLDARLDRRQVHDRVLGLRHDLLREHDHVAVLERDLGDDELGQIGPFLDLRQTGDRDDAELAAQGSPVRRMPACAL